MKRPTGGVLGWALQEAEDRLGLTVTSREKVDLLEEVAVEYGATKRMLDMLGWTVLDHFSGRELEVKYESRKNMAKRAIMAWLNDPLIGGSVALLNDFVLGRGVPKPRFEDALAQEVVDEAWDDPDNRRTLTDFEEQIALNTELSLTSNLLMLLFDEGEDGKVKVSTLDYMTVSEAVTDPENRHRVLWYVATENKAKWDFENDKWTMPEDSLVKKKNLYYEHWHNVQDAEDEENRDEPLKKPKKGKMGKGKVHHVRMNRTKEMIFGVPEWQRTLRWATAYNDLMKAQVDKAKAAAAFIMERRVQGTPNQVAKLAAKAISRQSPLSGQTFPLDPDNPGGDGELPNLQYGPARAAGIITSNEGVRHEALKIDSGAASAQVDAQNVRSQIAASTRFPQHYLGDASTANLATATSLELPVLKMVETRQEIIESLYRWFIDRVIERAVDTNRIPEELTPDEMGDEERTAKTLQQHLEEAAENGRQFVRIVEVPATARDRKRGWYRYVLVTRDPETLMEYHRVIVEGHEDKSIDEESTQRDLSYEFSLPSPLRRMMAELVQAIATIARTFDPNNTNPELSRTLLFISLSEGLEMGNAADMVDKIFPEGYVDPAIAAAQAQAQGQQPPVNLFGPEQAGQPFPPSEDGNTYGAPMKGTLPEKVPTQQAIATVGRDGEPVLWRLEEGRLVELPENIRALVRERQTADDEGWRRVLDAAQDELRQTTTTNGERGAGEE